MSSEKSGGRFDTVLKIACVVLVVGGTIWALMPARRAGASVRPAAARDKKMPDFSLPELGGGSWKLSDHRGQVVLVNFWATWCPPCRAEIPGLIETSRTLEGKPFAIAGIAMDDGGMPAVKPFASEHRIPYPILMPDAAFSLADAIDSLPTSFLVDKQGRIAKVYVGQIDEDVLMSDVRTLLRETS